MTFSRSSSSSAAIVLLAVLALTGCAGVRAGTSDHPAATGVARVAVLPLDNLSGGPAPVKAIRAELIARLEAGGVRVLPEATLEAFMARHRVRYVGGLDREESAAFRLETGVDAVLVTSLELYDESYPPRIALTARLVSTGNNPGILRMESAAVAGDDAPGLLGIGLIGTAQAVREKALDRLAAALMGRGGEGAGPVLAPATVYQGQPLDPQKRYQVAVLPFFNKGSRRYAGDILALHYLRELAQDGRFSVVEPGVVREELLRYRIIMEEGVSLADAELVFSVLPVDLLLTGDINEYEDVQGLFGTPKVDFTALMLNRDNRKAGWAVDAHASGDSRTYLFDIGRLTTANALAAAMVRGAVKSLTGLATER